ncbi:BTB/POZ domain-containing protein 6-like [Pecten maximus]|uniref:BTB/POZ domain-containing protein 6-like n=1 Tax=Pecten maximus TaxID=6579 RepID=UPI001459123C|nr:BTB/POZ domain-containing protein 6-like [Pecten maximus]
MANSTPLQSRNTLLECIAHMYLTKLGADVRFVFDGSKVAAHKFILISRSSVFEAMFTRPLSDQEEKDEKDIEITDVSKDTFNVFLRYLYTDNIEINMDNVADILKVADKYMVEILIHKCHVYIEQHLDPDNVCRMRERYHSFPNEKLLAECRRVEEESACAVLKSAGFAERCRECAHELISSDYLPVDEHLIFETVIRWAQAECRKHHIAVTDENIRTSAGNLFHCVRFPVMNSDYFCKTVFNMSVLSNDELVELHRYIHKQGPSIHGPPTMVQTTQEEPVSCYTGSVLSRRSSAIRPANEPCTEGSDSRDEAYQDSLYMASETTNHHLNVRVCDFSCKHRVGYRMGKYKPVFRQQSRSGRVGSSIIAISEHVQSSSLVYLHGITTAFTPDQINVKINDEDIRIQRADDDPKVVRFRKIIEIDPDKVYVIYVSVNGYTSIMRNQLENSLSFDGVTINFTNHADSQSNGYVTGLLLSK